MKTILYACCILPAGSSDTTSNPDRTDVQEP